MTWDEVCADPSLRDLPYKIETNGFGNIIMSPHFRKHSRRQRRIAKQLEELMPAGEAIHEAALQTSDGVKAPDVVWVSSLRLSAEEALGTSIFETAPEICIEVMSESNPMTEMLHKMKLYFEKGATEVWICDRKAQMHYYSPEGPLENSRLCPEFPREIVLD